MWAVAACDETTKITTAQPKQIRPQRRWYRYSLRTLLLVVLLCSLPLNWLGVAAPD